MRMMNFEQLTMVLGADEAKWPEQFARQISLLEMIETSESGLPAESLSLEGAANKQTRAALRWLKYAGLVCEHRDRGGRKIASYNLTIFCRQATQGRWKAEV